MIVMKPRPLWRQVADDLRTRISSGEWAVGDRIPTHAQLAAQYDVSSTVIRRAVLELMHVDDLLVGQMGEAVFVTALPEDDD